MLDLRWIFKQNVREQLKSTMNTHRTHTHPSQNALLSLDMSLLSPANIEAAWEQSQQSHQSSMRPSSHSDAYHLSYASAFPQYTVSPSSSSSSLTAVSSVSPSSPFADHFHHQATSLRKGFHPDLALPTRELFDFQFPQPTSPATSTNSLSSPLSPSMSSQAAMHMFSTPTPSPTSPTDLDASESRHSSSAPSSAKRTSTAPTSSTKKPRACMSTKDFVPPDVTGLSKREARLVKNRAAAFLSRQRKREEFELMEM